MTQPALLDMIVHDVAAGEVLGDRIWAEFREMPGLSLTTTQARRLFNIPEPDCSTTLDALVRRGLLRRCVDGQYRLAVVRP